MDYLAVYSGDSVSKSAKSCVEKLGLPLIIKPSTLGSSIGITVAKTEEDVALALITALSIPTARSWKSFWKTLRKLIAQCIG